MNYFVEEQQQNMTQPEALWYRTPIQKVQDNSLWIILVLVVIICWVLKGNRDKDLELKEISNELNQEKKRKVGSQSGYNIPEGSDHTFAQ